MQNSLKIQSFAGVIALAIIAAVLVSTPGLASAQWSGSGSSNHNGGWTGNGNGNWNGGGHGNWGNGYGNSYPPAPTHYNTGTFQVTYPNGYYYNYFVPTVRYFPPVYGGFNGRGGFGNHF
ncbi:MAG: hypothetical protein ABSF56_03090 [Minisyncoccia bacterium]|jgi:hypothetical protein